MCIVSKCSDGRLRLLKTIHVKLSLNNQLNMSYCFKMVLVISTYHCDQWQPTQLPTFKIKIVSNVQLIKQLLLCKERLKQHYLAVL